MKKVTVVICNPTEPIGLGQKVYGGVVSAAYDRELDDGKAVAVNEQLLESIKLLVNCMKLAGWEDDWATEKARAAIAAAEAQIKEQTK